MTIIISFFFFSRSFLSITFETFRFFWPRRDGRAKLCSVGCQKQRNREQSLVMKLPNPKVLLYGFSISDVTSTQSLLSKSLAVWMRPYPHTRPSLQVSSVLPPSPIPFFLLIFTHPHVLLSLSTYMKGTLKVRSIIWEHVKGQLLFAKISHNALNSL